MSSSAMVLLNNGALIAQRNKIYIRLWMNSNYFFSRIGFVRFGLFENKKNIDYHQLYPKAGHPVHSSRDKDDETELHPRQHLLPSLWESVASAKHFQPEAQN